MRWDDKASMMRAAVLPPSVRPCSSNALSHHEETALSKNPMRLCVRPQSPSLLRVVSIVREPANFQFACFQKRNSNQISALMPGQRLNRSRRMLITRSDDGYFGRNPETRLDESSFRPEEVQKRGTLSFDRRVPIRHNNFVRHQPRRLMGCGHCPRYVVCAARNCRGETA